MEEGGAEQGPSRVQPPATKEIWLEEVGQRKQYLLNGADVDFEAGGFREAH